MSKQGRLIKIQNKTKGQTKPEPVTPTHLADIGQRQLSMGERKNVIQELATQFGNKHLSRLLKEKSRNTEGSLPKNFRITIAADKEADWWTPQWYEHFRVGHSWIKVIVPDGTEDSYGFWPANLGSGGGFNPKRPWSDVPGEVRHPDTIHHPTASRTLSIDAKQLNDGLKYQDQHTHDNYNLLTYNCTTFAREMFEESTGQSAPYAGTLFDDPNDLAESIVEHNYRAGLDATEHPIPSQAQHQELPKENKIQMKLVQNKETDGASKSISRASNKRQLAQMRKLSNKGSIPAESFDKRYSVPFVPQTSRMSCWAAGAAMLISWRDNISIGDKAIAAGMKYWSQYLHGLNPEDVHMFRHWGLQEEEPQSFTVPAFRNLLENYGPLWVAADADSAAGVAPHIRVVTGIYGDGTVHGTFLLIHDPAGKPNQVESYAAYLHAQEQLAESELAQYSRPIYVAHL